MNASSVCVCAVVSDTFLQLDPSCSLPLHSFPQVTSQASGAGLEEELRTKLEGVFK